MDIYTLYKLLSKKMSNISSGGKEISVFIPTLGSAQIHDVVWHENCNEFHIILRTVAHVAKEN